MKTHVITLSKTFPTGHIRSGDHTNFKEQLFDTKLHTIRGNYAWWKPRIDEVNAGKAVLSIRQWIDRPYHQPGQVEIYQLTEAGIQPLDLVVDQFGKNKGVGAWIKIDEFERKLIDAGLLIKNDGLSQQDFYSWFKKIPDDPCIIHFTDLLY